MRIRKIEAFDETSDDWNASVEQVEQFFIANEIRNEERVAVVLSLMGDKTTTKSVCPRKPSSLSFKDILETFQQHLLPKPLLIAEQFLSTEEANSKVKLLVLTMLVIVMDVHSKWPEVFPVAMTNTTRTIEELRKLFTALGLPKQLVSDNGPQFIANEFRAFLRSIGIKHVRSATCHPSTNGLTECFVETFKQALRVTLPESLSLRSC